MALWYPWNTMAQAMELPTCFRISTGTLSWLRFLLVSLSPSMQTPVWYNKLSHGHCIPCPVQLITSSELQTKQAGVRTRPRPRSQYSPDFWMLYTAVVVLYRHVWATASMPAGYWGSRVVNGALGLQGDLPFYPSHAGLCDGWNSFRGFNNCTWVWGQSCIGGLSSLSVGCVHWRRGEKIFRGGVSNITISKKDKLCGL